MPDKESWTCCIVLAGQSSMVRTTLQQWEKEDSAKEGNQIQDGGRFALKEFYSPAAGLRWAQIRAQRSFETKDTLYEYVINLSVLHCHCTYRYNCCAWRCELPWKIWITIWQPKQLQETAPILRLGSSLLREIAWCVHQRQCLFVRVKRTCTQFFWCTGFWTNIVTLFFTLPGSPFVCLKHCQKCLTHIVFWFRYFAGTKFCACLQIQWLHTAQTHPLYKTLALRCS